VVDTAEVAEVAEVAGTADTLEAAEVAGTADTLEAAEVAGTAATLEAAAVVGTADSLEVAGEAGTADTLEAAEVAGTADSLEVAGEAGTADNLEVAGEALAASLEVVGPFKAARWGVETCAWVDSDRMWVAPPVARGTLTITGGAIIATTPTAAMVFGGMGFGSTPATTGMLETALTSIGCGGKPAAVIGASAITIVSTERRCDSDGETGGHRRGVCRSGSVWLLNPAALPRSGDPTQSIVRFRAAPGEGAHRSVARVLQPIVCGYLPGVFPTSCPHRN
jgi:hypothetical protein